MSCLVCGAERTPDCWPQYDVDCDDHKVEPGSTCGATHVCSESRCWVSGLSALWYGLVFVPLQMYVTLNLDKVLTKNWAFMQEVVNSVQFFFFDYFTGVGHEKQRSENGYKVQPSSTAVGQRNSRLLPVRVSHLLHVLCLNLVKSDIQLYSNLKETQKPWTRYMLIFVIQSLQYPSGFTFKTYIANFTGWVIELDTALKRQERPVAWKCQAFIGPIDELSLRSCARLPLQAVWTNSQSISFSL